MDEKCAKCGMALDEQNKCASDPTLCKNCCPPSAEGEKPEAGAGEQPAQGEAEEGGEVPAGEGEAPKEE